MGVLSRFFPRREMQTPPPPTGYYKTVTESAPSFTAWSGSLYDHPVTRAAIERFASACSKLKPEFVGSKSCKPNVRKLFDTWPNDLMTWPQFLARCATIYQMDTTVFIVPGLDRDLNVTALFPLKPSHTDVVEYDGEPWFKFHLRTGDVLAIECSRCAVVSKFQYLSDFFGSGNDVMNPTLALMDAQRQAELQAVQNGARIRFIGRVSGMTHGDDLRRKREAFFTDNLSNANKTGLMLYDNTFDSVTQVKEDRFIIDKDEMERVQKPIHYWFGTNDAILTNDFTEDQWGAYYESEIEKWALHVTEAMTKMLFTVAEVMRGNHVMLSSSRLEYASNNTKLHVIRNLAGMGIMTVNEAREIMQLPPIPGGDIRLVRGEYYGLDLENNIVTESGGHNAEEQANSDEPDDTGPEDIGPDDFGPDDEPDDVFDEQDDMPQQGATN